MDEHRLLAGMDGDQDVRGGRKMTIAALCDFLRGECWRRSLSADEIVNVANEIQAEHNRQMEENGKALSRLSADRDNWRKQALAEDERANAKPVYPPEVESECAAVKMCENIIANCDSSGDPRVTIRDVRAMLVNFRECVRVLSADRVECVRKANETATQLENLRDEIRVLAGACQDQEQADEAARNAYRRKTELLENLIRGCK